MKVAAAAAPANRLAPIRAFCASPALGKRLESAPVHNFFLKPASRRAAGSDRLLEAIGLCEIASALATNKKMYAMKTLISSAFSLYARICLLARAQKNIFRRTCCARLPCRARAGAGGGVYTQN